MQIYLGLTFDVEFSVFVWILTATAVPLPRLIRMCWHLRNILNIQRNSRTNRNICHSSTQAHSETTFPLNTNKLGNIPLQIYCLDLFVSCAIQNWLKKCLESDWTYADPFEIHGNRQKWIERDWCFAQFAFDRLLLNKWRMETQTNQWHGVRDKIFKLLTTKPCQCRQQFQ